MTEPMTSDTAGGRAGSTGRAGSAGRPGRSSATTPGKEKKDTKKKRVFSLFRGSGSQPRSDAVGDGAWPCNLSSGRECWETGDTYLPGKHASFWSNFGVLLGVAPQGSVLPFV